MRNICHFQVEDMLGWEMEANPLSRVIVSRFYKIPISKYIYHLLSNTYYDFYIIMHSKQLYQWKRIIILTMSLTSSSLAWTTTTSMVPFSPMLTASFCCKRKTQWNDPLKAHTNNNHDETSRNYYIRHAQEKDLVQASKLLTDAFFHNDNIFIFLMEWLKTYFSLKDGYMECQSNHHHEYVMLVACKQHTYSTQEQVLALCEVDFRSNGKTTMQKMEQTHLINTMLPYVCNLVVKPKERNKGIGKAMLYACEQQAKEWEASNLYLKVRNTNIRAIEMYTRLGYQIMEQSKDKDYWGNNIVLMTKVL
jgi:ribosomal protein S18 acetylase RimI-like enzyme